MCRPVQRPPASPTVADKGRAQRAWLCLLADCPFGALQVTAVIELSLGSLQMPLSTLMMVPDLPQGLKLTQLLQISLEFLLKILIM